jgi:iron complex outermembrane recepter protein
LRRTLIAILAIACLFSLGSHRAFAAAPAVSAAASSAAAKPTVHVTVRGTITDQSGAIIPDAAVSLTDMSTNNVLHTISGSSGEYVFTGVSTDKQVLTVVKAGFETHSEQIKPATQQTVNITMQLAMLSQSVTVRGTINPEATPVPTRQQVMMMPGTVRVINRKQIEVSGPVAGGAQMVQSTPGANVMGYGQTGATKYTILLNGVEQGWAGEATGFTGPGSLGVTFDGVPTADPATGLWQSATMPQNLVIQNLKVTYGPGQPMNRWYTDVGGRVEFTPVQPTVGHHFSIAATQGPYGQQNIAFVGNTGEFHGWSTVVGGGVGRGDSFRRAPDGFGNHAKSGSVFGKTLKTFSLGSVAFGVVYAKAGGYRPTVIPTTDVGLVESNGTHFSQPTSGFYSALPYADYNKYDTNEMALVYTRERFSLTPSMTLENLTWYNHIRRFHHRTADSLDTGPHVDEWNNPHSNIFGEKINVAQVLPYNTINFGGYFIHELYNSRNMFFNPNDQASGKNQVIGFGTKFRSGYFDQNNVTFYAQDDIHPIPQLHIIPGVRVDGFNTNYSDQAYRDFSFAPGVIPSTHCSLYPDGSDPMNNVFGTPNATDQGSLCASHESRSAVEPSIDASVYPTQWLTIYGGYDTTYRSPAFGGGGGLFQQVDPRYYILAEGKYAQVGAKVHFTNAPGLRNFILGVNYFHNAYTNQEIDVETAAGVQLTSGGSTAYHGVDLFFDDDPTANLHFFLNFAGETSKFTTYVTGGTLASCGTTSNPEGIAAGCQYYNNLPVSYVPDYTLNTGVYYAVQYNHREILEPSLWLKSIGSQHLWSNETGAPVNETMPAYTTLNLSVTAPFTIQKQSVNLKLNVTNLGNAKYNEYEYISSGGYFAPMFPDQNNVPSGYINAYPGAPATVYGTISYQF